MQSAHVTVSAGTLARGRRTTRRARSPQISLIHAHRASLLRAAVLLLLSAIRIPPSIMEYTLYAKLLARYFLQRGLRQIDDAIVEIANKGIHGYVKFNCSRE